MIGVVLIAAALALAAYCVTAPGPILLGTGPLIAALLALYGTHLFQLNRRRRAIARRRNRRGGYIA